jgi:hypothetical protein
LVMIAMALRRGAKSKIGEARFGKCRLTITPPEFIKGVRERRIFRKKKLAGEDPPDPLTVFDDGGDSFELSFVIVASSCKHPRAVFINY